MNLLFLLIFFCLLASLHTIDKSNRIENLCPPSAVTECTSHTHTRTLRCPRLEPAGFDSIAIPWSTVIYGEAHYVETCTYPVCFFDLVPFPFHYWRRRPTSPSHYYRETFLIDRNGIEADVFLFFNLEQNQRRPRSPPARRPPGLPSLPSARSRLVEEV